MGEARVAPKESTKVGKPDQTMTWGSSDRLVKMRKDVIAAVENERRVLAEREDKVQTAARVAFEAASPTNAKAAAILKTSREAQARLISRLVQTQLMGEFLQLGREQVNWRNLVDKAEQDPLLMAAADVMADHVAGPGIYVTADNDFAKAEVEDFFENIGGEETGGMESLVRECARDIHLYGIHIWQLYTNPYTKELKDVRIVPLESIYRVHRDDKGNWVTLHQMPEYYGEPVEARRLAIFKWRPVNQSAFGSGIAQVMYISRRYSLAIRDNTTGQIISQRTIIVPSQMDGRTMLYDIMLKVFQRYGMPYQAYQVGDKDQPADTNIVETLVKPSIRRREELVLNRPFKIVSDEIDPRTRFEAYMNELTNLNIVTMQTPILKLWAAPEGMTEASARTALKAFDRIVLSRQRFIKRIIERRIIPAFLRGRGINPEDANVRLHFGPIDKPELSYNDLINIFERGNQTAVMIGKLSQPQPPPMMPFGQAGSGKPTFGKAKTDQQKEGEVPLVMSVGEFRQNLRRFGIDLEEQMPKEQLAEPAASLGGVPRTRKAKDGGASTA